MKIVAAMSGGVDSSVATARMIDAGHEVTGVHLALSRTESHGKGRGCCTLDDARDARRVADTLGIPFYVWDMSERFAQDVMADFEAEYRRGRTPNPCLRCNEKIKFSAVLDKALALGFDGVATGHYARVMSVEGTFELHRGIDPSKDQSYVLAVMAPSALPYSFFPLGGDTKDVIRQEAAERGLLTARKPDSHDICFIPDGDTAGYLTKTLGEQPGEIRDSESGAVLGTHQGTFTVTIGQRRGLGLTIPAEDGQPRYVVDIDPITSTVTLGTHAELAVRSIITEVPIVFSAESELAHPGLSVQVRAHGDPVPCTVARTNEGLRIDCDEPIFGLASGQCAVVYQGDRVLASATIAATVRESEAA